MAIFLYKKHPDHNLGGENYPHFRNQTDKLNYFKKFINVTQALDFEITRVSFDSAIVTIDQSELNAPQKLINLSGIATGTKTEDNKEFWWVTGWNYGANKNTISFQLTLDYWLTYWPLEFNTALVRIARKHNYRLTWTDKTKTDYFINWGGKFLQTPEQKPANITNVEYFSYPVIKYNPEVTLILFVGIVFINKGGYFDSNKNYLISFGKVEPPGNQNGYIIFESFNNNTISSWFSLPNITQTFYFFMKLSDIEITAEQWRPIEWENTHQGSYRQFNPQFFDFTKKLPVTRVNAETHRFLIFKNYIALAEMICNLISLSYKFNNQNNQKDKLFPIIDIDKNDNVTYTIKNLYQKHIQVPSLKLFFKNKKAQLDPTVKLRWYDQIVRKYNKYTYFTTLNIFNFYFNHKNQKDKYFFNLEFPEKKHFPLNTITKTHYFDAQQVLKIISDKDYYLAYQSKIQKFDLWWYWGKPKIYFNWIVAIQNNYLNFEFDNNAGTTNKIRNPGNKKYNFVAVNETKIPNYTDQSIEFYQQQGFSFEQGLNQAKYQINWLKRYQQFFYEQFLYQQISNVGNYFQNKIGNVAQGIFGALSGGNVSGGGSGGLGFLGLPGIIATPFINNALSVKNFDLNQELARKNALYNLKNMLARQADIFNNPVTTHDVDNTEFNYWLISSKCLPYVIALEPTAEEKLRQATMYHQNGEATDVLQKVNFNSVGTRYGWNYWEIHNIEQAIVKDNLNSMVINYFNKKFNDGVRLWNVFHSEITFNNYDNANWNIGLLKETPPEITEYEN